MGALYAYHDSSSIQFVLHKYGGFNQQIRFEMSLINSCGVEQLCKNTQGGLDFQMFSFLKNSLFDENRQSILPNGTLTVCCRLWGKTIRTSEFRFSSVLNSLYYLWNIKSLFSCHVTYFEQENFLLHVYLKKKNEKGAWTVVGRTLGDGCLSSFIDFALSIKDSRGRVIDDKPITFPYINWLCDIEIFPNNTSISLQLDSIVAIHKGCQEQHNLHSPTKIAKSKNVSEEVSCALGNDLPHLYRESALSDATLNTDGKSFSAHRSILAARSPVFRAMFERDEMSEGRSGVLDIDDVDSETVDRMLVNLYGDSLGDLQWKEASALYYAADKYDVLPLKEKCAAILKAGLTADNACDLLVLADKHLDHELMKCVVNFILDHEEVVSSAQWEELENANSMLAAKVARQLFLKTKEMRV